jgi:hypothetical protein
MDEDSPRWCLQYYNLKIGKVLIFIGQPENKNETILFFSIQLTEYFFRQSKKDAL